MKFLYTKESLVSVLPGIKSRDGWNKCGLSSEHIRQVTFNGYCHSLIGICNYDMFMGNLVSDVEVLTFDESDIKYAELIELKEAYDATLPIPESIETKMLNDKISLLQEENNRMKEALKLLLTEEQIEQLNL